MKILALIALACSLVFCGCYLFTTISESKKEISLADPDEHIRIHLDDSSEITLYPYHFVQVSEPSEFVYGSGERWDRAARRSIFRGKSSFVSADSFYRTSGPLWNLHKEISYYDFMTEDGSILRFARDNYVVVKKDQGAGLWCAGQKKSNDRSEWFTGRIPSDRIVGIEAEKFSPLRAGLAVAGLAAWVYLIVDLMSGSSFSGLSLGNWNGVFSLP